MAIFQAWIHSQFECPNDLTIEVFSTVLNDAARASSSFGRLHAQFFITVIAQSKREDSGLLRMLSSLLNNLISVAYFPISEEKDSFLCLS